MHGMQTRPRSAVLVSLFSAMLAGVLMISGCSKSEPSAPLPDAATLLKQSADTTRAQQSVHIVLTVNGKIAKLTLTKLVGDLTQTPAVAAKGNASLTMGGMSVDAPFVVYGGDLYASLTGGGSLSSFGPADKIYDIGAILNPQTGLANVLSNMSEAKAVDRETINGVSTIKVTGTVSQDAVNRLVPQLQVNSTLPSTAWIADNDSHQLIQSQLEVTPGNNIQMTLSDWGKPVTVEKPAAS
jgi:lipoprotein LprG